MKDRCLTQGERRSGSPRLAQKILVGVLLFSMQYTAHAIPQVIQYQGKATDKADLPISGTPDITFRLYDAVTAGSKVWKDTHTAVPVENGLFSVLLGCVTPLVLSFEKPYWLSVEIDSDGEMSPRQELTSVPYAYRSQTAATAEVVDRLPGDLMGLLSNYRRGARPYPQTASSVLVSPGAVVCSNVDGTDWRLRRNVSAQSISLPADLDTGIEEVNAWYYIWAIADDSDPGFTAVFSKDKVAPSGADYYHLLGAVRNDSSGNILQYRRAGDFVQYAQYYQITQGSTDWSTVDLSAYLPSLSKRVSLFVYIQSSGGSSGNRYFRPFGTSATNGVIHITCSGDTGDWITTSNTTACSVVTDEEQRIETNSSGAHSTVYLNGYWEDMDF